MTADDSFGSSVAVSEKTVVVGARSADSGTGAVYTYVKGVSGWPKKPAVTLTDPAATFGDEFGSFVAVSGKTVIVGAYGTDSVSGETYIYVEGTSGWPTTPTTKLTDPAATSYDIFGFSVAISDTTAVVGAYGTNTEAGTAYIYVKDASGWPKKPTTALSDPAATAGDDFGSSVAVSGKTGVVGASGTNSAAGAAYIYKA